MTHEHLVEDIRNVLELVNRALADPAAGPEAQRAIQGLNRHIENEEDVPGPVAGCLREAAAGATDGAGAMDTRAWQSVRACLEAALEFATG